MQVSKEHDRSLGGKGVGGSEELNRYCLKIENEKEFFSNHEDRQRAVNLHNRVNANKMIRLSVDLGLLCCEQLESQIKHNDDERAKRMNLEYGLDVVSTIESVRDEGRKYLETAKEWLELYKISFTDKPEI